MYFFILNFLKKNTTLPLSAGGNHFLCAKLLIISLCSTIKYLLFVNILYNFAEH